MSNYQHRKGQIIDNALEALLHDPLFRQRIEQKKKGKGSYQRKEKHGKRGNWEASGKQDVYHWLSAFKDVIKSYCSAVSRGHEFQSTVILR